MDKSNESCKCSPSERIEKGSASTLKIKWKRLISKGETCLRCGSTEEALRKAESTLKQSLAAHYVENSQSEPKNILEKEDAEKCPERDAALIEKGQEHEDNTGQELEQQEIQYEKSVEERRRKKKMTMVSG